MYVAVLVEDGGVEGADNVQEEEDVEREVERLVRVHRARRIRIQKHLLVAEVLVALATDNNSLLKPVVGACKVN